jgi:uncharacterized membrane protein YbhN (UPF0104 family)
MAVAGIFFINSYRWKLILNHFESDIAWREILFLQISSEAVVSLLPFRMGEAAKLIYLKKRKNIFYSKAAFSIICGYIIDFIILVFSIAVGMGIYLLCGYNFKNFVLSNKSVLFLGCFYSRIRSIKGGCDKISKMFFPFFNKRIKEIISMLKDFRIVILSIIDVALDLLGVYLLARALNFTLPIPAILLFVPIIILISSFSISLQGLGIREISILFLFAGFAPAEKLFSLSILYFSVECIFPMVISTGLAGIYINRISGGRRHYGQ